MKRNGLFFAVCVLAFGLVMTGCSDGGSGNGSIGIIPSSDPETPAVYTGTDSTGKSIELKVAKSSADLSKAAITPKSGHWYSLEYDGTEISRGTISISGVNWTFNSTTGTVQSGFKATVSSGTLKFTVAVTYKTGGTAITANIQLTYGARAWPADLNETKWVWVSGGTGIGNRSDSEKSYLAFYIKPANSQPKFAYKVYQGGGSEGGTSIDLQSAVNNGEIKVSLFGPFGVKTLCTSYSITGGTLTLTGGDFGGLNDDFRLAGSVWTETTFVQPAD